MIIGIMGTPVHSNNMGVLALGTSLIDLCKSSYKNCQIILFIGNKSNKPVNFLINGKKVAIPVSNCRLSPRSKLFDHLGWILFSSFIYRLIPLSTVRKALCRYTPWIAALEKTHFVGDIRGGDSFSDIYGMRRFLHGFAMALTVILVKGSIIQFPQTFGPYKSPMARLLARYLLRRSSVVIARDQNSQEVAQTLVGQGREVLLSPDVAFSLEAIQPENIEVFPPSKLQLPTGTIGINVNGLMYNGGYTRNNMFGLKIDYRKFLHLLIKSLLFEHSGELWLVPHTFAPAGNVESDTEACRRVRQALPDTLQHRVRIVTKKYNQHEIKGLIRGFDFFIGSRMHACIAALSQGVPCVGVAYSKKFEGVFESVGMHGWVVDCRNTGESEAIAHILKLYRMRKSIINTLAMDVNKAHIHLKTIFEKLFIGHDHKDGLN